MLQLYCAARAFLNSEGASLMKGRKVPQHTVEYSFGCSVTSVSKRRASSTIVHVLLIHLAGFTFQDESTNKCLLLIANCFKHYFPTFMLEQNSS